jgi:hypothetical protein
VTLAEKKLQFSAHGYGDKGQHNYGFVLDFYSSIDPEVSTMNIIQIQSVLVVCMLPLFTLISGIYKRRTWLLQ